MSSAAGQTIGIFEDASAGAAYLPGDVNSFVTGLGLAAPKLTDILLLGYTNNGVGQKSPARRDP